MKKTKTPNYFRITLFLLLATSLGCNMPIGAERNLPAPDPTKFDFGDAADPSFPSMLASNGVRTNDLTQFWFGALEVPSTAESDANLVDMDAPDDGLIDSQFANDVLSLKFKVVKARGAEEGSIYFNLLVDADGNGRWQDFEGASGLVREWLVINQVVDLLPGQGATLTVETPLFSGNQIWIRALVSDLPIPEGNYPNGWDGTHAFANQPVKGEVEDHRLGPFAVSTPTATNTLVPTETETPTPTFTLTLIPATSTNTPVPPTFTPTKGTPPEPLVLDLSTNRLSEGERLRIRGANFSNNGEVRLDFVCGRLTFSQGAIADAKGKWSTAVDTKGIPKGKCLVTATDLTTRRQAQTKFTIQ